MAKRNKTNGVTMKEQLEQMLTAHPKGPKQALLEMLVDLHLISDKLGLDFEDIEQDAFGQYYKRDTNK